MWHDWAMTTVNRARSTVAPARRFARTLLALAAILAGLGLAALLIDVPLARWFKDGQWPAGMPKLARDVADECHRLVTMSEVVAHTASVAVILALVLALDRGLAWPKDLRLGRSRGDARAPLPPAQGAFGRMLGATFAGGITTDVIKLFVERVRPRAADFAVQASVWDGFRESTVASVVGSRSNIHSFPSGHSAIAAGLAAALAWRYPRARGFFSVFAVMAMAQRVVSSAHFPSDVCFGAAIGLAGAAFFLSGAADGGARGDSV